MGLEDLSHDAFLGGKVHLWQPRAGYRAGLDPVLLAATVHAKSGQSVLDLGCGVGAASLCLGARVPGLDLHGLEIQAEMAGLARRNGDEAGQPLKIWDGDIAELPAELRQISFDHVISNPPYYLRKDGSVAPDASRERALGEVTPLELWIKHGARRLKPKGYLHLIVKADRLGDAMTGVAGVLGSPEIMPFAPRVGKPAELVILRARKDGRARLRLHAPVILHEGEHHPGDADHYTRVVSDVLRCGAALEFQA